MEFCFLTGGLLLGLFFADRASSCSVFQLAGPPARFVADGHLLAFFFCRRARLLDFFADRASSYSVFQSADSLPTKDGDIEYARLPAYKGRGI